MGTTQQDHFTKTRKRVLEPHERVSEVLFGLIMVLTFTGSLSVAQAGQGAVKTMLIGALGCNLAWGIIDGVLYLMGCLAEKAGGLETLREVQRAATPEKGQQVIANALSPVLASAFQAGELEMIRQRVAQISDLPECAQLSKSDWWGALGVFLLVFLSTFPVTIPFMVMHHPMWTLRVSNAVAIGMLFFTGYIYGKRIHRHPGVVGVGMVVLGLVLVALTIALGG